MHDIEPYYNWRDYYIAAEDEKSPLFGREYSEFQYHTKIYNYFIHPQWDDIGSPTLFIKLLYVEYRLGYAIIELFGEWNDAINNDIKFLKRSIVDPLMKQGISKFILLGENVLNFHLSDDCYYEEWYEDTQDEDGWVVAINFRKHVVDEMRTGRLHHFLYMGENYYGINWRPLKADHLFLSIEKLLLRPLNL